MCKRPHWLGVAAVVLLHAAVLLAVAAGGTRAPAAARAQRMTVSVSLAPPAAPPVSAPVVQQRAQPARPKAPAAVPVPPAPLDASTAPVAQPVPQVAATEPVRPETAPSSEVTAAASAVPPASVLPPPLIPPRADAAHLNNPAPPYPSASRRFGEQGRVLLDVYILADGSVGEIRLKRSSGFARLDQAALDAVRRWRFLPARRGEQPVAHWYVQPITFSLET